MTQGGREKMPTVIGDGDPFHRGDFSAGIAKQGKENNARLIDLLRRL